MKKRLLTVISGILMALFLVSCSSASSVKVDRIDSSTLIDLSGRWNDTDVRLVCESLIKDCFNSPRVAEFIKQYASRNKGRIPACVVGTFRNDSSEHIDTSIIAVTMESTIVNSGKMDFVSGGEIRQEIRDEKQDQQANASEDTAAALGYETGASLLLTGSVKSIVDRAGNTTVRSYFVNAEMTNIETNVRLWTKTNNEIKKVIRQSNYRY